MDTNTSARQRASTSQPSIASSSNHSSPSSGPGPSSSGTFRRLPALGRSPFRRDKGKEPADSGELGGHHRVSTFPALSRFLGDHLHPSPPFMAALSPAEEQLVPPERSTSLRSDDSLPETPFPISRETMQSPSPNFANGPDDLEPITYPSHLAQTRAPEAGPSRPHAHPSKPPYPAAKSSRQRDFTLGSGQPVLLGAVHSPASSSMAPTSSFGRPEPGPGGPPMGVPRRKESIAGTRYDNGQPMEGAKIEGTIMLENGVEQDTDSGGETATWKNPTAAPAPERALEELIRPEEPKDRSRKPSARSKLKSTEPSLPSSRTVQRVPSSAMYFSPLPNHGQPPGQPLRAHTGTLVGERIWYLGGVDGKHCWRGAAWFDTESLLWTTVETSGDALPPLRAHTTTLVGDLMYIFGGGDGSTYSNEVWAFNTATHRFSRPHITTPRNSLPPPRRAHTTVLYRNFLVVFGGGNGQAALNDVWALDVSDPTRLTWHEWRTRGEAPQKKGYHTSNLIGHKMIVFGGSDGHASFADVHVLNLQTLTWTVVVTDVKYNRLAHTSTQVGSYLFIIGGHNGQTYAQDVLLFNLVTLQWESKITRGVAPPGRGYHVALLHDARIFISGGYNGVKVFDDLWVLDLSAGAYLPQVTTFEINETGDVARDIA